jgi:cell shape-determining protein MreC
MRRPSVRSQLLFPGLLFLALTLFCVPDAHVQALRGRALSLLSPVLQLTSAGRGRMAPQVASIKVNLQPAQTEPEENQAEEVDRLRGEVARLLDQVKHLQTAQPAPGALREPPGVQADVIARQVLWQEPCLGLNRGEDDGVKLHAGVLHRGVVVGRIVATGPNASSMALLTHRGLCVGARLVDCRVEGVLSGAKDDGSEQLCRLAVVCRDLPAKVGEMVVTSGLDGSFPAGLWLGVVTNIKKITDVQWELTVRPACNPSAIESVHVLTVGQPAVPWPAAPAGKGRR